MGRHQIRNGEGYARFAQGCVSLITCHVLYVCFCDGRGQIALNFEIIEAWFVADTRSCFIPLQSACVNIEFRSYEGLVRYECYVRILLPYKSRAVCTTFSMFSSHHFL